MGYMRIFRTRIPSASLGNYYHHVAANRPGTLASAIVGRAPLDCAVVDRPVVAEVDSPQLLSRRRRQQSNNGLFCRQRFFHVSPSLSNTRLKSTMASATTENQNGSNGGNRVDVHKAPASSWVGHEGAAAFDLRSEFAS